MTQAVSKFNCVSSGETQAPLRVSNNANHPVLRQLLRVAINKYMTHITNPVVERVAELPPPTPAEKDDDSQRSKTNHIENAGVWLGQTIMETPLPQNVASYAARSGRKV